MLLRQAVEIQRKTKGMMYVWIKIHIFLMDEIYYADWKQCLLNCFHFLGMTSQRFNSPFLMSHIMDTYTGLMRNSSFSKLLNRTLFSVIILKKAVLSFAKKSHVFWELFSWGRIKISSLTFLHDIYWSLGKLPGFSFTIRNTVNPR